MPMVTPSTSAVAVGDRLAACNARYPFQFRPSTWVLLELVRSRVWAWSTFQALRAAARMPGVGATSVRSSRYSKHLDSGTNLSWCRFASMRTSDIAMGDQGSPWGNAKQFWIGSRAHTPAKDIQRFCRRHCAPKRLTTRAGRPSRDMTARAKV